MNPDFNITTLGAALLSGGAIVVSLIWKFPWPCRKGNGNGHTKDIIAHDVDISRLKDDVSEIKRDVGKIWEHIRKT